MIEAFEEFCEGWIGGAKGSRPHQRNELFTVERLKDQYDQICKARECNRERGAIADAEDIFNSDHSPEQFKLKPNGSVKIK